MQGSLGEKVGAGAFSEVYAWAPGQVVKLFKAGISHLLGRHEVRILGDNFDLDATIDSTAAGDLGGAPFRTLRTSDGLRVDWLTPGGGLQSTWILN